ncbi:ArsR/SmtB family transcription factor [Nitrososphaera viennensis]|uniref:Helix-turn-helix domain-containing protein n=2 Tax=Nitrososphaera viennensis TaxID=1034015 RepID=A0A977ICA8_9ARCH|nr:helix-turn-helix domain-containing protein [Nitrososphaera viennensis]AIC16424.1 putative transcriptional regulatory protein arsR family [Nitrososphaera viennensis EN76]UVS68356.1 helix-turn-helix domain-containing protein [Nitrososphaera viennensis]
MESDIILDILGNDTRRKILAMLSQEPMYFNQLAREIDVGQQAVLRHLQALEESGLIETYAEKSSLGAPDRKYYRLNNSFILTVSLSEDDFTVTKQEIVESRHKESKKYYKVLDLMPEDAGEALASLKASLSNIETEMSNLESRLNDLRALKQLILNKLHKIGMEGFEEDERKILYMIVKESPSSIAELSDMMDEKESDLKTILSGMRKKMNNDSAKVLLDLQ